MKLYQKIGAGINILRCRFLGERIPAVVSFEVISRCNANCRYCDLEKSDEMFTTEEACALIREAAEMGAKKLAITGGEPLLRDDIGVIVGEAKRCGLSVNLNSNGRLVPERIEMLKELDLLAMSLDGPKDVNDRLRGNGSFDAVMNAIDAAKKNNIKVGLTAVLSKNNMQELDWLLETAKDMGVPINFQPVVKHLNVNNFEGDCPDSQGNEFLLSRDELKCAIEKIKRFRKQNPGVVRPSDRTLNRILDIYASGRRVSCGAGIISCRIEKRGLTPCARCLKSERVPIKDSLADAWMEISSTPKCSGKCCTGAIELANIWTMDPRSIINQGKNDSF